MPTKKKTSTTPDGNRLSLVLAGVVVLAVLTTAVLGVVRLVSGTGTDSLPAPTPLSETSALPAEPSQAAEDAVTAALTGPSAADPDAPVDGDAVSVLAGAAREFQSAVFAANGVTVHLTTPDGQDVHLARDVDGNFRARTNSDVAPEWALMDGVLYARLGAAEITEHQADFASVGKPDAEWTSVATIAETQRRVLSAGDLVAAAADLGPWLKNPTVEKTTTGVTVSGVVPATGTDAFHDVYNLGSTATVTFFIDQSGSLTGYTVEPINGAAALSAKVEYLSPVLVSAPDSSMVITAEDLSRAAVASPSPTPTPTPTASRKPKPRASR